MVDLFPRWTKNTAKFLSVESAAMNRAVLSSKFRLFRLHMIQLHYSFLMASIVCFSMIFYLAKYGFCAGQSNMQNAAGSLCKCQSSARPVQSLFRAGSKSKSTNSRQKEIVIRLFCRMRISAAPSGVMAISRTAWQMFLRSAFPLPAKIHLDLKIPIGLIETAVESTHIHSWLSSDSIEKLEFVKNHINETGFFAQQKKTGTRPPEHERICQQPSAVFQQHDCASARTWRSRHSLASRQQRCFSIPKYYSQVLPIMIHDWQQIFHPADRRGLGFFSCPD